MSEMVKNARNYASYELGLFANTIEEQYREDFFHPCNKDEWVRRFCEWLAEKQAKSAAFRASND